MKKKIIIITGGFLAAVLLFAGCASSASDEMTASEPQAAYDKAMEEDMMAEEVGFGAAESAVEYEESDGESFNTSESNSADPEELSEKIIYNVYASLSVDVVDEAVKAITAKVESLGGYISYSNVYNSSGYNYANMEVRVPAENLSKMEEYTYSVGKVEEYTMSTDNITESYYDIKGRLDNALAQEEQLLLILEQAETVEDILLVRSELDQVQERIESYKGRMRVWDSLVDYSTVSYYIRPIPKLDTEDDGPRLIKLDETWRAMKQGFRNSAISVANFFSYLLRFLANLWTIVILGIIVLAVILIVKRGKKRRAEKEANKQ